MPRRNHPPKPRQRWQAPDPELEPGYQYDAMARRLVAEGRAPAAILGPHRAPTGAQQKGTNNDR